MPPQSAAARLFISCWNNGEYGEVVNILPAARMLPYVAGRLDYSDGAIIGEAFNSGIFPEDRKPKFYRLNDDTLLNPNWANANTQNFVRFAHIHWLDFWGDFEKLDDDNKAGFKNAVAALIGKIRTNVIANTALLTVADLPGVNL